MKEYFASKIKTLFTFIKIIFFNLISFYYFATTFEHSTIPTDFNSTITILNSFPSQVKLKTESRKPNWTQVNSTERTNELNGETSQERLTLTPCKVHMNGWVLLWPRGSNSSQTLIHSHSLLIQWLAYDSIEIFRMNQLRRTDRPTDRTNE